MIDYITTPWAHQREANEKAEALDEFAFLFEMGTGKTKTTIDTLREKYAKAGRTMRTLILCPPIVVKNWEAELVVHSRIPRHQLVPLVGPGKKRVATLRKAQETEGHLVKFAASKDSFIAITNYEALLMKDLYETLREWEPEVLVLDESHKCKDVSAKRTKAAIALAEKTRHRFLLSGTPTPNSPLDLFAQWRILDKGESLGRNFFAFRARYFYDANAGMPRDRYFPDWKIRPGALAELNAIIYKKAMRVTKAEALDLPPLVNQTRYVELSPEQARLYNQMKEEYVAFLGSDSCVGDLAITRALRLQQIVSGYLPTESGERKHLANPRLEALRELLEELTPGHKVIVWSVFHENYAQIRSLCDTLKVRYVEVHGGITAKDKDRAVDVFTHDPGCRVLIGNQAAGGIGINLVAASYSIFYSRNFNYVDDAQAEARNHRGGSKEAGHEKITRIDLVAPGTIDEIVLTSLARKENISEELLKSLKDKL